MNDDNDTYEAWLCLCGSKNITEITTNTNTHKPIIST